MKQSRTYLYYITRFCNANDDIIVSKRNLGIMTELHILLMKQYKYICTNVSCYYNITVYTYSGVRVIASRILHEISLLIGELAIRGTKLTLNACLGTKSNLLIEQFCY